MPKFRTLSGDELLRTFSQFGFSRYSQRRSHVKLRRVLPDGARQSLTIVAHKEVDTGTESGRILPWLMEPLFLRPFHGWLAPH